MSRGFRPPNLAVLGAVVLVAWPNAEPDGTPKEDENGVDGAGVATPNPLPPKELIDELTPDPNTLPNGVLEEGRAAGAVPKGDFVSPPTIPKGDFVSSPRIPKVDALLDARAGKAIDANAGVDANDEAMFPKPNEVAVDEAEDIAGETLSPNNGFEVLYLFASLANNSCSRPYLYCVIKAGKCMEGSVV